MKSKKCRTAWKWRKEYAMKTIIVLSYLIPLFLPLPYSSSMLWLGAILLMLLLYCQTKRKAVYHAIQKQTNIDLSEFMKTHFSSIEREKHIVSEEEMPGHPSEKSINIMKANQEIFVRISPVSAKKFFHWSGKVFILKLWLIVTLVFAVLFRQWR